MDDPKQPGNGSSAEAGEDRLTSWKEIAAYLRQGVTTVQRWEQERELPVYRQADKKRGLVYAYKSELDDWWRTKGSVKRIQNGPPPGPIPRWMWLAVALVLVLTGALAAVILRNDGSAPLPSRQAVATLRFAEAAVSPDGRWLAYTDVADFRLWLRDLRDGSDRLLVDANAASLAWARDSRRLAYVRRQFPRRSLEIVSVESGEVSVVLEPAASGNRFLGPADWSPDGQYLLGFQPDPNALRIRIGFLRIRDGVFSPRFDLPPGAAPSYLRLSPDGRFAAYSTARGGNRDIYMAPLDGDGQEIRLTRDPQPDREPVWSPDGRYVLFDRRHGSDGDNGLWAVPVDPPSGEAEPVRIGDLGYQSWTLRKSFDAAGNLLVGSIQEITRCQVLEVDPATGRPVGSRISDFPEYSACEDWSADGNSLSYTNLMLASQSPEPVRVVRNIVTHAERLQTSVLGDKQPKGDRRLPAAPRNVPDYRWRFYSERRQRVVMRYDMVTEQAEPFWESEEPVQNATLSPNADYLAVRTTAPHGTGIWLLRLEDKKARKVATTRLGPAVTWSRDGAELAFADANCLMVMRPEDPEPTRLACTTAPEIPDLPSAQWPPLLATTWLRPLNASWNPDGTKLSWSVAVAENRRVELWIIDRATGEHEVALAGEPDYYTLPWGAGWSPNGKWLALDLTFFPDHVIQALSGVLPTDHGSVAASSGPF